MDLSCVAREKIDEDLSLNALMQVMKMYSFKVYKLLYKKKINNQKLINKKKLF